MTEKVLAEDKLLDTGESVPGLTGGLPADIEDERDSYGDEGCDVV